MERYSPGQSSGHYGSAGHMEADDAGEWVKYDDVWPEMHAYEVYTKAVEAERDALRARVEAWEAWGAAVKPRDEDGHYDTSLRLLGARALMPKGGDE